MGLDYLGEHVRYMGTQPIPAREDGISEGTGIVIRTQLISHQYPPLPANANYADVELQHVARSLKGLLLTS